MCCSLTNIGKVYLVCADGNGNEIIKNVNIVDVGKRKSLIQRMTTSVNLIYKKAIDLDADIYHLHDPELIRIGLKLIKKGKKVIFDNHEDVGATILDKYYLKPFLRKIIYKIYKLYEKYSLKKFSGLISATPYIKKQLLHINSNSIDICNYPIIAELENNKSKTPSDNFKVCYVGGVTKKRGLIELVRSLEITKNLVSLNLVGNFYPKSFEKELKKEPGWKRVNYLGYLDREQIKKVYDESIIGLVTLHPTRNYINSLPIKMFEYMISELPIIASNFQSFINIFNENKCGLNVDPKNPLEIANAIDFLIENPDARKEMGQNGKKAIINNYNWTLEEKKLIKFYNSLR
jgi:glycosyltransferase involved in cell wall biosynthesis